MVADGITGGVIRPDRGHVGVGTRSQIVTMLDRANPYSQIKNFNLGIRVLRTLMPRKRVMPSHAVSNAPLAL